MEDFKKKILEIADSYEKCNINVKTIGELFRAHMKDIFICVALETESFIDILCKFKSPTRDCTYYQPHCEAWWDIKGAIKDGKIKEVMQDKANFLREIANNF